MVIIHLKHIKNNNKCHLCILIIFITLLTLMGCVEPFEVGTQRFSDILVVNANITNELKQHQISLTHTFRFEDEEALPESNATVIIKGGSEAFTFEEISPGTYQSTLAFAPNPNEMYQLFITTIDGTSYTSDEASITTESDLDVYVERFTNEDGEDGIGIFADSNVSGEDFVSYRYDYEETYLIKSRRPSTKEIVIISRNPPSTELRDKQKEDRTCYNTNTSKNIMTIDTDNLEGAFVERFPIRFINKEDPILRHRYSILVNQRVLSTAAREFYQKLKDISSSESLFSEVQPGFIGGNIHTSNPEKKVLGLFEIANISSKRIFLDFLDFFDVFETPILNPNDCPTIEHVPISRHSLIISFIDDGFNYLFWSTDPGSGELEHNLTPVICNDCTLQNGATNIKPDFWVD